MKSHQNEKACSEKSIIYQKSAVIRNDRIHLASTINYVMQQDKKIRPINNNTKGMYL